MQNNILEIKNLTIDYVTDDEVVHAVKDLDLILSKGGMLGLVGETGAGKTTTALSIMGLLPQRNARIRSGEILFNNVDLLKLSDKEMDRYRGKTISMIYQDPMTSLNPTMSVGKQIREVLLTHGEYKTKEADKQVNEILEMVGISESRSNEYPHQFSGGMKQRVVIAMALACNPTLLIADEPTTALDVTIQSQVLDMIKNLKKKINTSLLLITHDLGVVGEMCDDVAIMYAGRIAEYGEVEEVFINPTHPYTEGLLGSIPDIRSKSRRLKSIPGLMPDPTLDFPGCEFAPRCPLAQSICEREKPSVSTKGTHQVRCHMKAFDGDKHNE